MLGNFHTNMSPKSIQHTSVNQGCIYYKLVNFFPQPGPTRVDFFHHLLFSFSVLHTISDTFYGLKLVHSALKALTKPLKP